jgi:hypothetical protein
MSGPDRPIQPENRREAMRWMAIVDEDIAVAVAAVGIARFGRVPIIRNKRPKS